MAKINLKPIVSLIDIMDKQSKKSQSYYQIEQTEPLNLCLNNNLLIIKSMDDNYLKIKDSDSEDDKSDVVFVKEYKLEECSGNKGRKKRKDFIEPRRNPKRQVRKTEENRNEFVYDSGDDDKLNMPIRNQDISDEWSCENPLKTRQKQNNKPPIKRTNKRNKKYIRDINRKKVEKKAITDLEPLITTNLNLIKAFLTNFDGNIDKNVLQDILKDQLILFAVTKTVPEKDLFQHL